MHSMGRLMPFRKGSRITAELKEQKMISGHIPVAVMADLDRCEVRAAGLTVTSRTSDWL